MTKDNHATVVEFLMLKVLDFRKATARIKNISEDKFVVHEALRLLHDIKNTENAVKDMNRRSNIKGYTNNRITDLEATKNTLIKMHDELNQENRRLRSKISQYSAENSRLLSENYRLQKQLNKYKGESE